MERKNSKVRVFFIKMLKILVSPVTRLRKIMRRISTRKIKIAISVVSIITPITIIAYLYHLSTVTIDQNKKQTQNPKYIMGTPIKHVHLDEVYKDFRKNGDKDYLLDLEDQREPAGMVDTPGCKIPVALLNFEKYMNDTNGNGPSCGKRAIFLRKLGSNEVIAEIKSRILQKYTKNKKSFDCCHQFILDTIQYPHDRPKLIFSNCTKFQDGSRITLQSDFINILCKSNNSQNISVIIYEDMYAFTKKLNLSKPKNSTCKYKYNVLMVGMESMSLPRAVKTMPRTVAFFKNDNWLGFRGYHKIADNTFPDLMAAFTGCNYSMIAKQCHGKMDDCNKLLIWKTFKDAGYVTAYGEDYLQLPDTFAQQYKYRKPPTDHYIKPFYMKGETKQANSSLVCAGKVSSGQQLLDYALDFANTYKKDSFFGVFWINSFSHDAKSHPENSDKVVENFFNQLAYTGVMANTFIIFFSDHGIRFGKLRLEMESYYDDHMPMNFMWLPLIFKARHPYEVRALAINQFRLMTPYDLYSTLLDIKRISLCSNDSNPSPAGCPKCHSLFNVIDSNRTCHDAAIHDKWCSCHKLFPLPIQDTIGIRSVEVAERYIQNLVKTITTQRCWGCMTLTLKDVIRIHFYYNTDRVSLFYVVAFTMTPGNATYEATVLRKGDMSEYTIVGPITAISNYRGLGKCALSRRDRLYCVCQKKDNCVV